MTAKTGRMTTLAALPAGAAVEADPAAGAREALQRAIFDSSDDAMLIVDEAGRIRDINAAGCALFERAREEMVGERAPAFVLQHGGEASCKRCDGTSLEIEVSCSFHAALGVHLAVLRDVTAKKQAERRLVSSQKMDALGRLAGGVAHDFNNLLTVILSYADLLLDAVPEESAMRADLEQIKGAGHRARELTQQLLTFSRRMPQSPRAIDPNAALDGIEKMVSRILGSHIVFRAEKTGRRCVWADAAQLDQVFMNLIVNARDAMPDGGNLTVTVSDVDVEEDEAEALLVPIGEYVEIAVSDDGVGMDDAVKQRIFEPFFTTKEAGRGTGLGLATVFGIAKQSGGGVFVESAVGAGTTVRVLLPVTDRPLDDASAQRAHRSARGRGTVLLVEDDEAVRAVAASILERAGYTVVAASSAREALAHGPVDVLVSDVLMPDMNGRELFERLRAQQPSLKGLFISGYSDHVALPEDVPLLEKPFSPEALVEAVNKALTG